jgi:hypothetical protein
MSLKEITPDEVLARVLYRDGLMLIVDKPAGLPVHRGPKGGASLEDYFDALRFGLPRPPALAHRLDKDTSGCLVLGRHRKALAHLGLLFKHGKVGKTYWAVVEGGPDADEGTIALPLGRLDETRGWWMKPDPNGLPSVTTWKVLGRSSPAAHAEEACRRRHGVSLPPPLAGEGRGGGGPSHQHKAFGSGPRPTLPRKRGRKSKAHLARSHAGNRPHPSVAGSLRRLRMADRGRQYLWNGATLQRTNAATPCARDRGADLEKQGASARHCTGAGPHARSAAGVRLERRGSRNLERIPVTLNHFSRVMAGLVPAIHVLLAAMPHARRRCPRQARA